MFIKFENHKFQSTPDPIFLFILLVKDYKPPKEGLYYFG